MSHRRERGFTLLELLIALAIVATLVAVAFGGLRVALAAWRQGDDRVEAHQHARGLAMVLSRALAGTYPYRAPAGQAPEPVILFSGSGSTLQFITAAAPFPFSTPIAYTAVAVAVEQGERPGLVVRQRPVPNREPFSEMAVVYVDPSVSSLSLAYLAAGGTWEDGWEGASENGLPHAVRVTLTLSEAGRTQTVGPVTVSVRLAQ